MKKSHYLVLASMLLACLLPGCKKEEPIPVFTVPETTAAPTLPAPTEPSYPPEAAHYRDILTLYRHAAAEKWEPAALQEADISILNYFSGAPGYALLDVLGDEEPELLLGNLNTEEDFIIYDVYTFQNNEITHILSSMERNRYYLALQRDSSEYYFAYEGSSGAGSSVFQTFYWQNGLYAQQTLKFDSDTNPNNPWSLSSGENAYEPIEEALALAILAATEEEYIRPEYMSFI